MFWMLFTIVFIVVAAIFIYVIVGGITTYVKNNNSPVVETSARVCNKETRYIRNGHHRIWLVTFETSEGDRKEFHVGRDEYERLCVGDQGQLKLDRKSTRLNSSHLKLSRMPSSA